jgi:hypothetical protein
MASIARDKNGNRRILFVAPDGRRPAIRLGKAPLRIAEDIKTKVQQLADALRYNQPVEGKLADWVAGLEGPLAKKLARVGLIPNPEPKAPTTLAAFLKSYIDGRTGLWMLGALRTPFERQVLSLPCR